MNEIIGVLVFALVMVIVLGIGAWIGWRTAHDELADQETKLQAGWDALHRTQRVNAAFWQARQALRDEAMRHTQRSDQQ